MSGAPLSSGLLLVIGDAPEVGQQIAGVPVLRVGADEARHVQRPTGILVDGRAVAPSSVADLRRSPSLADAPLLWISDDAVPEALVETVRADDTWQPSSGTATLRRRLERLLELDRLRRNLPREVDRLHQLISDKQRFDHAILDGVDAGIVTTDRDGVITFLNRAATELLGAERALHGARVRSVLGLSEEPGVLLGGDGRLVLAYSLPMDDRRELDLHLVLSRGDASHDDRVGFFFIFRDVGEEKQQEAERQRFERLAAMGTMVAGFAHEVRNPIAAMRSLVEQLQEELLEDGVQTPHVAMLLRLVARLERLVRTSLRFGRPTAPKRARRVPGAIVQSAVNELALQRPGSGASVAVDIEPGLGDVVVDDSQIAQALVILLDNAIDSTGDPCRVRIRACRARRADTERRRSEPPAEPVVRFEVIDDGPGIAPDTLERVFDPFFTTKPSGTGLGLPIAQQIASENGARLEVASQLGGPTCFAIVVPVLAPADAAAPDGPG